jgi:hypothetical protein
MSKAVRFDRYGNVDVLEVTEVERPTLRPVRGAYPWEHRVLVRTIAAGTNSDWLRSIGVTPLDYETNLRESLDRLAPDGFDAAIDTVGHGYVDLAITSRRGYCKANAPLPPTIWVSNRKPNLISITTRNTSASNHTSKIYQQSQQIKWKIQIRQFS